MKREKRPWMLLYLLVGVLVLSTGLNFYLLLQLDSRMWAQQMKEELEQQSLDSQTVVTLRLPAAPQTLPDTTAASQP